MRPVEPDMTSENLTMDGKARPDRQLRLMVWLAYGNLLVVMTLTPLIRLSRFFIDDHELLSALLLFLCWLASYALIFVIVIVPWGAAYLIWKRREIPTVGMKSIFQGWILLALPLAGYEMAGYSAHYVNERRIERTPEAAQPIISAVLQFRADKGYWPSSFDLLPTEYLKEIPDSPFGSPFYFYIDDCKGMARPVLGVDPFGFLIGHNRPNGYAIWGAIYYFEEPTDDCEFRWRRSERLPGSPPGWYFDHDSS